MTEESKKGIEFDIYHSLFMMSQAYPTELGDALWQKETVIVDIGGFLMPILGGTYDWMPAFSRRPRVIVTDPQYSDPGMKDMVKEEAAEAGNEVYIEPGFVERINDQLRKHGIEKIDLFTMLNPSPLSYRIPVPLEMGKLAEDAPLVTMLTDTWPHHDREMRNIEGRLTQNGYTILTKDPKEFAHGRVEYASLAVPIKTPQL